MSATVPEAARDIPVLDEVDVLVAGGGVSGCAAALGAARAGARTLLLERNGCLGGVATATLMANIGGPYLTLSGRVVPSGVAAEVIERLIAVGGASPGCKHADVPGCTMDSERLKVILIEMLEEAGVTVLTHTLAARPILDGDAVRGGFIESKSGRQTILAKNTVDATGEIDLVAQTPAGVVAHRGNGSLLFKIAGVDLDRFVAFVLEDPDGFPDGMDYVRDARMFAENWRERGVLFFPHYGGKKWRFVRECIARGEFTDRIAPAFNLDVLGMYAYRPPGSAGPGTVVINSNYYIFERLDIRDLSRYETHAQKMCYYVADFLRRKVPGFGRSRVEHVGVDLGLRGARYIKGRAWLREDQIAGTVPVHFDDVIAVGPMNLAEPNGRTYHADATYDIPLGVVLPQGAGRVIVGTAKAVSTDKDHKRIVRGMVNCMQIGQAAGIAAALGAARDIGPAEVPIREIQRQLLSQGAYLGDAARLRGLGLR